MKFLCLDPDKHRNLKGGKIYDGEYSYNHMGTKTKFVHIYENELGFDGFYYATRFVEQDN